ncbi:MAG: DUF106 domain-containing protein [Candidatus Aenigmarchaeota archaeon]|nr:DUF106 domain-containing protein [Candidatus Aenigmarchaeota archaeon]
MVFDFIPNFVDPIFNPLLSLNPVLALLIFSGILTSIIYFINKIFVNQKELKKMRQDITDVREKLSEAQKSGNKEEINKLLNDMMKINNDYFKQTFKTLIVSMIVLVLLFPWANNAFGEKTVVTHPFISFISLVPLLNLIPNWLAWYILSSITISWLLRKFIGE